MIRPTASSTSGPIEPPERDAGARPDDERERPLTFAY